MSPNLADNLNGLGTCGVPGEHDIEIIEIALVKTDVKVRKLLIRSTSPFELFVPRMIACRTLLNKRWLALHQIGGYKREREKEVMSSKENFAIVGHTKLHSIQCRNVTAQGLHNKCSHLIADISAYRSGPDVCEDRPLNHSYP